MITHSLTIGLLLAAAPARRVATPTFSPAAGAYSSAQTVTVRTASTGAALYCSTTGAPARTAANRCGAGSCTLAVPSTATLQCRAAAAGRPDSLVASAAYTISGATAACASAALRSTGTVYYYCDCQAGASGGCVAGNDANAGTSASSPRQTYANAVARFNAMNAGDTIAFCRGGAFSATAATFANPRCTPSSTCDVRDYTPSGMTARPVFSPGTSSFVAITGSGVQKQGYRFWNLDVRHTGAGITFNIGDSSTDIDICNVAMSGGDIGVLEQTTNQRITLRNSTITQYTTDGFLGGSNGLVIDSNVFTDCGIFTDNRSHSIYIQGGIEQTPDGYHDLKVTNNDIVGTAAGTCIGTVFTASGRNHDLLVENNRITMASATGGCYGFIVAHGFYPYGCWHYRAIIRRNRVIIPGSYVGIAAGVCVDCQITDNVIAVDTAYDAQRPLVIPESPWRSAQGDVQSSGAIVQNNTIYQASSTSVTPAYSGVVITEGTGHVIENNAVFTGGSSSTCYSYSGTTRASNNYCRSSGGASAASVFLNVGGNNFRPAASSPLIGYGSSTYYSPTALSPTWSATDTGAARAPPIDAGALIH